jgi:amidophosphoribosyltransferase
MIPSDHVDDALHEECGVFGIFGHPQASALTALGLHALQHRGQEAAGMVSYDGATFYHHHGLGHVADNFANANVIERLKGSQAVGHVRYSTTGDTLLRNVQPLFAEMAFGGLALGHNGNLTNAMALRKQLVRRGCLFSSTTDTEVIIHLIAISLYSSVEDRLIDALKQIDGAYSLVVMTKDTVYGVRDPLGIRPLVIGKVDDALILASESCALDIIGAEFIRDVEPGEIVCLNKDGIRSIKPFSPIQSRFCIFEYIYFARPDSVAEGRSVYEVRKSIGAQLAIETPVDADMVVPVPDSGVPAALGYANQAGLPFDLGIIRNHYVGRTFIQPTDGVRNAGVKMKHNANRRMLEGKRVILVDDSIVRGTTSRKIVEMVRQAGATEVHMRISSPPTTNSCYFGIDTPEREQLLAYQYDLAGMSKLIGVDSLAFISIDGLYKAVGEHGRNGKTPQFCDACFTGDYPFPPTDYLEAAASNSQLSLLTEESH